MISPIFVFRANIKEKVMSYRKILLSFFLFLVLMSGSILSAQTNTGINVTSQTPENKLILLRNAMSEAKTNLQKVAILKEVGHTSTFLGMMYAARFLHEKALQQTAADVVVRIALAHREYNGENVRCLLKEILNNRNLMIANRIKQSIRKYLKNVDSKETGFVSLFNGKDLSGWRGLVQNPIKRAAMQPSVYAAAQEKADAVMRDDWQVIDGLLTYVGKGFDNICTVKKYADFEMYVDWKLDPNGKEPDAGIYLRGTPQVQIWDIARINVGAQVGSGGLYNNKVNRSTPLKVADNKLGEWNSFYIKMVGDKVSVYLNGEKVVDNIVLENYWDRKQAIFPKEQIELQAHGSRVYFRDIYIREIE